MSFSRPESFGLTVLEALAAGAPSLVNDEGGLSELARLFPQVVAVRCQECTAHEVARFIQELQMRKAQADLRRFRWGEVATGMLDGYGRILGESFH